MGSPGRLVTLSTDIGAAYAAQMKAVLAHSVAAGHVVDLSHDLPRHAIVEGAFLLRQMAGGFPAGTVHVAVVDPGVGGPRRRLAVACGDGSRLVGPDNGILYPLAERLGGGSAYAIDLDRLGLPGPPSATFEGRDVFAPAAARLAAGDDPARLGVAVQMTELRLPEAHRRPAGVTGVVLHTDRFGNLITNVPSEWLPAGSVFATLRRPGRPDQEIPLGATYEALAPGGLGLLASSFGTAEISVREGSAAERTGLASGAEVELIWRSGRPWAPPRRERRPEHRPRGSERPQDGK